MSLTCLDPHEVNYDFVRSTNRTASCLNSCVYRARFDFSNRFPFADFQLWDTFCTGKITRHNQSTFGQ